MRAYFSALLALRECIEVPAYGVLGASWCAFNEWASSWAYAVQLWELRYAHAYVFTGARERIAHAILKRIAFQHTVADVSGDGRG